MTEIAGAVCKVDLDALGGPVVYVRCLVSEAEARRLAGLMFAGPTTRVVFPDETGVKGGESR